MSPFETRFLADSMLGRLAKWLRVMGLDTHYQPFYKDGVISHITHDGRMLLSRQRSIINQYPNSLLILSEQVKDQLHEIRDRGYLQTDRSKWFARCLICNTLLKEVPAGKACKNIPEYVFYQNIKGIRLCPTCGRYFWPGSHKKRMISQLENWGFGYIPDSPVQ